jgi:hypothetical protein
MCYNELSYMKVYCRKMDGDASEASPRGIRDEPIF